MEFETNGRCGGMAFAALDYYLAGIPVPDFTPDDFDDGVPPDDHELSDYLWSRQVDSVLRRSGGWRFIRWSRRGRLDVLRRTEDEVGLVIDAIDDGKPVVLGLIAAYRARDVGDNHQVVCYAYEETDAEWPTLYLYDPNHPAEWSAYPRGRWRWDPTSGRMGRIKRRRTRTRESLMIATPTTSSIRSAASVVTGVRSRPSMPAGGTASSRLRRER